MKISRSAILTMLFFVGSATISAHTGTEDATPYVNPIIGGDYPDPTIVRDGDDYYMTHSAFDFLPGLVVMHSKDLVHWEPISFAVKEYLGSIWAPDICKYDDKYYIYFTVSGNPETNYVVWAESPYGPWSEPIDLKINSIDPCHAVGEDGQRWMFLSGGRRVKLAPDGLSIIPGTDEYVYGGWQYPADWEVECFCMEGPKIKKIGDYYYYLSAEGGTAGPATSHMVTQARSKSIDGPWENAPNNPLIHTYSNDEKWWSKGHGSLIDTPDGQWMIVYHAYENGFYNLGRQTLLEPVWLGEDGWFHATKDGDHPLVEETALGELYSPLAAYPLPDMKERLNEFRIGLDWKSYKDYSPERFDIVDNVLTMAAKGDKLSNSCPLLFAPAAHSYQLEAEIEIQGDLKAGFVLYYNSGNYVGYGFDETSRIFYISNDSISKSNNGDHNRKMWLRLKNDNHKITAEYSYDGQNWHKEQWTADITDLNHNKLGEFQSIMAGIFAFGDGKATVSNFKFSKLNKK